MDMRVKNSSDPSHPLAVTVPVARALLGIGNTTIWALIRDGELETVRIGRRRLVVYASIESLLARLRQRAAAA
jgi:excisionase family DNA binding protein